MSTFRYCIAAILILTSISAGAGENREERLLAHADKVELERLAGTGIGTEQLPDFPADCDPFPIPTSPEGSSIVRHIDDFDDSYELTVWRYPCNGEFSWVIFTVEPESGSEPFLCQQIELAQDDVVSTDYYLSQDPAMADDSFCGEVTGARSFAVSMWSSNEFVLNLQDELVIDWDTLEGVERFTLFPYDAEEYGPEASPILNNQLAVNGLFYDPGTSGQGFDFNLHAHGLTVFFYGHTATGERLWLISDTYEQDLRYGEPVAVTMYEVPEGSFGNPGPLQPEWGTLTVTLHDCDSGVAVLDGMDGTLSIDFVRLVGLADTTCARSR